MMKMAIEDLAAAKRRCRLVAGRAQQTIERPVALSGLGLHTGAVVQMQLLPAPAGTGLLFKRTDLPGQPCLKGSWRSVSSTNDRNTTLGQGDLRMVTVEHLMAALYAHGIDNLVIELDNLEPPIGNGSSDHFVSLLVEAGKRSQPEAHKQELWVDEPLFWSQGAVHLVALPCSDYQVSYTLSYPDHPLLQSQYHSLKIHEESFGQELAPCRTFCLYEEVALLIDKGLIRGASLDNGVIVDGKLAYSKGGLFFSNEMARHKILDLVGDLALLECDLRAHLVAIRSGHAAHFALVQELIRDLYS